MLVYSYKIYKLRNMDQKSRVNAAISYMFLGELFLLAKNNPNFSNAFVRNHSKNATKIHFSFLAIILVYKFFIDTFLYINVPIINISLDRIIETILYSIFTIVLIRWAYKAYYWKEAEEIKIRKDYLQVGTQELDNNISETQKMLYITSYIPFIGLITGNESNINKYWAKIWWIFSVIFIFLIVTSHSDIAFILSLLYIIFVVFAWVIMLTQEKIVFSTFVHNMYDLKTLYAKWRTLVVYIFESILIIFWRNKELNFSEIYWRIIARDEKYDNLANNYLTDDKLIFGNKIIFIPILNLIYLPTFLTKKKSKYIIAIIQWLIISVISIIFRHFDYSTYSSILLFPIFLWLANVNNNPFYRIPIIYEIYEITDKLTFGIFSKIKFLREKKNEVQEVSFKI